MNKNFVFRNVRVFHKGKLTEPTDFRVKNGIWTTENLEEAQEIKIPGACILPALTALWVDFHEPMRDDIYTFRNGFEAMRRGGFRTAVIESAANPVDDARRLQAYKDYAREEDLRIGFLGNYFRKEGGLSEMLDMARKGVWGFGDGGYMQGNARFLRAAMEYGAMTGLRLFFQPQDESLLHKSCVHEGAVSDTLGMRGIPRQAETIAVHTLLELAHLTGAKVHLKQLTCGASISLVESARNRGVDVTCDVSVHHLLLDDNSLFRLDSNTRIRPPLRETTDRDALWDGLSRGIVAAISCAHIPVLEQDKLVDYEDAVPGAISLEIALPALIQESRRYFKNWTDIVDFLNKGASSVLGLSPDLMEIDQPAHFVLWQEENPWTVSPSTFAGRVCNSPLLGKTLEGKIAGVHFASIWRDNLWTSPV